MVSSDWTMQFLADILDAPVDRPTILETTALGAAWLAGWKAGVWPDMAGFAKTWALDRQLQPGDGQADAEAQACRVARCGAADADDALTSQRVSCTRPRTGRRR